MASSRSVKTEISVQHLEYSVHFQLPCTSAEYFQQFKLSQRKICIEIMISNYFSRHYNATGAKKENKDLLAKLKKSLHSLIETYFCQDLLWLLSMWMMLLECKYNTKFVKANTNFNATGNQTGTKYWPHTTPMVSPVSSAFDPAT